MRPRVECKLFLERVRKCVERAQAVVDRACEQKVLCEAEVAEGDERYAQLLAEAAPVVSLQVTELQEWIKALLLERNTLRAARVNPDRRGRHETSVSDRRVMRESCCGFRWVVIFKMSGFTPY